MKTLLFKKGGRGGEPCNIIRNYLQGILLCFNISMRLLIYDAGYIPNVWLSRCMDLPSEQSMRLAFEGRLFAYDALYLDNVTVANQPCEGNY